MEMQTTEPSENLAVLPVISTETTETLGSTPVAPSQTPVTPEQSPHPVISMQTAETTLPHDTSTMTTETLEQPTVPEVTNTQATESLDKSTSLPATSTLATETLEQSNLSPNNKTTNTMEQSVILSELIDNSHDNLVASPKNHQVMEMRQETAVDKEEVRSILKGIAATGKFWHDWEKLRSMLSFHLKQVISEYPQAKMTIEEQKVSLGETHAELVKRLDDALHSFIDGPPFTLQRLSEIILDARSLYPNLSKLALALEKNLSVTSTLTISTDLYQQSLVTTPNGPNKATEDPNPNIRSDAVMENGGQTMGDEIMTEVEADVSDVMTMEMESYEKSSDKVGSSCVVPSKL